jgi:hypothetical protein
MALGSGSVGESGWSSEAATRSRPKLPPPSKRKTLTVAPAGEGKVKQTYQMSIQRPKNGVDEITEVTLGHVKLTITPTDTPGWMQLVVESVVAKP